MVLIKVVFSEGGNGACVYIYPVSNLDVCRSGWEQCDFDEGDNGGRGFLL